jgi:hypothetical protein
MAGLPPAVRDPGHSGTTSGCSESDGYAAEPLLDDLKSIDPVRHTEAVVRSAEFNYRNPNLAGLAPGATVRASTRRSCLRSRAARPRSAALGALGDQLFWAGLVPALVGVALAGVVLGARWWAELGFLVLYNLARGFTGIWALRTGYDSGMTVGAAIARSWLPRAIERVGPAAGFAVGLAVPLVAA